MTKHYSVFTKLPTEKENITLVMLVDIEQISCRGEAFRTQLQLIEKTFKNSLIIILVASTLQRFIYEALGLEEKLASDKARQNGQDWIRDQEPIIHDEITSSKFEIKDWEYFKNKNEFQVNYSIVKTAYENDEDVNKNFINTALSFLANLSRSTTSRIEPKIAIDNCLKYVFEECAIQLMLADQKYNYVAYPMKISDALNIIHQKFINEQVLSYLTIKNKIAKESLEIDKENKPSNIISFRAKNDKQEGKKTPLESEPSSSISLFIIENALKMFSDNNCTIDNKVKIECIKMFLESCKHTFVSSYSISLFILETALNILTNNNAIIDDKVTMECTKIFLENARNTFFTPKSNCIVVNKNVESQSEIHHSMSLI